MKRLVLSAMAVSMLAASTLQGLAAPVATISVPQSNVTAVQWQEPIRKDRRYEERRHGDRRYDNRYDRRTVEKRVIIRKDVVREPHWKSGQRYREWKRYQGIRDYHRYGLRRPGAGQQWIRVGDQYLLVGIATGLIAGALAAR
ncbi:MAG TPA: RcnB family protein [Mesorhizobium sp.]|jgi:Ni/Co efflux regulator RcnB|uniref:RcnB family protein n=1 Tax=Mesorhizobium sp. TaxID=1871066 RepID=UPI002DDDB9C9|nr:RcnB family protein [Mesorhizobium sp.]HEV2505527.1 RcnB family protein [Mesorhizobium sp.]